MNEVDSILNNWFGEPPEHSDDERRLIKFLYEPLRKIEAERDALLEALRMWLHLHEAPAGYEGKYGKALDAAIAAQQVKIDAAANAARAAIKAVEETK